MKFDIITIFPKIFDSYFSASILARAQKKGLVKIGVHDLRLWTADKHRSVDDSPFGGGPGMVMKVEPLYKAVKSLKAKKSRVILFSAKGKEFGQSDARRLAKYEQLILICGRYEGVDERIRQHLATDEISIGDYVLTGGELPALIVVHDGGRIETRLSCLDPLPFALVAAI